MTSAGSSASAQRYQEFRAFVEERPHWTLTDDKTTLLGKRTFEYGRYTAQLWTQGLRRLTGAIESTFYGHVSIPYAAGPEETTSSDWRQVVEWLEHRERVLEIPLRIAESRTWEQAMEHARRLRTGKDLFIIAIIFDINYHILNASQQHQDLVKRCAPRLAGQGC